MSFQELVRRTWRENILFTVLVELTYRCNLDCAFCYNDLSLVGRPLTDDEYFRLLAELSDMQVLNLVLSGGEPLAHPSFFAIAGRARELGFAVRIKTNGHALRGALLERVARDVRPLLVEISLHGATAAVHEAQTRVPGSFGRLLDNLRAAKAAGLKVKLNSTLTRLNEGEVEAMFALADELGMPLVFDPKVSPKDDGDLSPLQLAPTEAGLVHLIDVQEARGRALGPPRSGPEEAPAAPDKHCGAGSSTVAIDPFGNVYPCVAWRRKVGNLRDAPLAELWRGPALAGVRDETRAVKTWLDGEGPALRAGFCPGAAESERGSSRAIDLGSARLKAAIEGRRARLSVIS